LALCEIAWVIKFHFPTKEVNHVDKILGISVTPGASFSQLDFAIDAFQYAVCDV
jgi:hypothetical protein